MPETLKSINVNEGLHRAGGNQQLYQTLLKGFFETAAVSGPQLLTLFNENNATALSAALHKLAGIAGNIGANQLYTAAIELSHAVEPEADLSNGAVAEKLHVITEMLECIAAELSAMLPSATTSSDKEKPLLSVTETQELIKQLTEMIKESDAESLTYIEQLLEENSFPGTYATTLKNTKADLDKFDFEAALKNL
jgi:HPt (histidine-containing phosphotransfer) domain-containing protein